jgi:hypothetical protein
MFVLFSATSTFHLGERLFLAFTGLCAFLFLILTVGARWGEVPHGGAAHGRIQGARVACLGLAVPAAIGLAMMAF